MVDITALSLLGSASFFTAMLSATIGMGGGIVLLSVMTFFLPINVIVPVHGVIQLFSNSYRTFLLRKHIIKPVFLYFCLGLPVGTLLTISFIKKIDNPNIALGLVCILILYTIFKPKKLPPVVLPYWGFIFVGILVGFFGPLVGATGPFSAIFFIRDDFKKEQIVATKSSVQVAGHLIKIPTFIYLGFNYVDYSMLIMFMILLTLFGTKIGVNILGKIKENQFKIIYKVALFSAALRIMYKIAS